MKKKNNFPIHPTPKGGGLSWEIFRNDMFDNLRKILLRFFKECSNYSEMMRSDFARKVLDFADNYSNGRSHEFQNPIDGAGYWGGSVERHAFWQTMAAKLCVFMLRYQQEYDIDKRWLKDMVVRFRLSFYSDHDRMHYIEMDKLYKKMFNSEMKIISD